MKLNISVIQTALVWEDIDANLAMLEEKIWSIGTNVDIIVLPEMFSTGFSMNAKVLAEPMNSKTFKWMKFNSAQTKAVILGSYIVREGSDFFNRLVWMQPDGKYEYYDKRHTFTLTGESNVYKAGQKKLIVEWKGWKICPLICYDLRFPVWCRNRVANNEFEYDLLIVVANWPASRNEAWETLLKARAVENSSFCLGVNIVGTDGRGFNYVGNSSLYNPLVQARLHMHQLNEVNTLTLDKIELESYRVKFPFLEDGDAFEIKI